MALGKIAQLEGLKPCGCTDRIYCPQHWSLLTLKEKMLHHSQRGARGTGRGRNNPEEPSS